MDFTNKTAIIITGASSGIGNATAQLLVQKACNLYNLDIVLGETFEGV
jgi:NADP-dependent 3-hydroxy acid dehydrogenase YdfG